MNNEMPDYHPQLKAWLTTPAEQRWELIKNLINSWHGIDLSVLETHEDNLKNFIGSREISKGIKGFLLWMQKMTWVSYKSPKGIFYTAMQYVFVHTYEEFLPYFDDELNMFIILKGQNERNYLGILYKDLLCEDPIVQHIRLDKKVYKISDSNVVLSDYFLSLVVEFPTKPAFKGICETIEAVKYSDFLQSFSNEFPELLNCKIDLPTMVIYEACNVFIVIRKPNEFIEEYWIRIGIFKQEGQKEFVKRISEFFGYQTKGRFWTEGWSDNLGRYKF